MSCRCVPVCVCVCVCACLKLFVNIPNMQRIVLKRGKKQSQYRAEAAPHFLLLFLCVVLVLVVVVAAVSRFLSICCLLLLLCCSSSVLSHSLSLSLFTLILKHGQTRRLSKCLGPQKSMLRNFKVKCFPWILKCLRVLVNSRQEEDTAHRHAWIHIHIRVHASTCCQLIHKQSYRFRNRQTSHCVARWRRAVTNS